MSRWPIVWGICLLLLFTGCIEIVQVIKINPDQSGEYALTLDLKGMHKMMAIVNQSPDKSMLSKIDSFPVLAAKTIADCEGISVITHEENKEKGVYTISFHFTNDKQLNKALYQMIGQQKKWYSPNLITIKNHKVKQRNISPYLSHYIAQQKNAMLTDAVLNMITWKTLMILPSEATDSKNPLSGIRQNPKEVMLKATLFDIIKNKTNIGNKISY